MNKILVVTSPRITGLNYHRQLVPFNNLEEDYDIVYVPQLSLEEIKAGYCDSFQMVSFLRTINLEGKTVEMCDSLRNLGIKIHFDIDDYWVLHSGHPQYKQYREGKVGEQVVDALKSVDYITTTTTYLAEKIQEINKNVYILPNAIDTKAEQWQQKQIESKYTRFGYIAAVHHVRDVEMLHPNFVKLYDNCKDFQLLPAGFNVNILPNKSAKMNPYYHYVEQLFTDNYKKLKNKEYKDYLKCNVPDKNDTWDEPYKRLWGLDPYNYGKLYNFIDVALVPLAPYTFNTYKSELKMIEAGFMKKACIVSNVRPYDLLINNTNCIQVQPTRNHIDWYIQIKKLIGNKERISDLGEALYESVKDKYDIKNVNVERKQLINTWLA